MSVGQHPMVTRLLKGVFHAIPPLPRYSMTLGISTVLAYLSNEKLDQDSSLKSVTLKTVTLLALSRPSRSVDLSKLDISAHKSSPEGFAFLPTSLSKQSRQGKPVKEFFFPRFEENLDLCPVQALELYISKTKSLTTQSLLFISFVKPYGPVTSSTIARWLKETLLKAGIDTSIFKAHSIRGASTSRAANVGVTTEDILKAADWSAESTFQKFYYKPVHTSSFARSILSNHEITIDM